MTTQLTRHLDGFIPSALLLQAARRNPELAHRLLRTISQTNSLWQRSDARKNQLFRFRDAGTGERFMYDAQHLTTRPGTLIRKEGDAPATDAVINDGYDHHGIIRDFYKAWHGRNSIDGNGMAMRGIVHYDKDYDNAFWDSMYMTYGDGDGVLFLTFMLLNIAAHEMTHGVTEHAVPGGIEYWGMAGAINEHLSDVGGANVESWFLKLMASKYHFLVGKGIWVPQPEGSTDVLVALRDMRHPGTAYNTKRIGKDPQPATMKDYVKTSSDSGGVHINSGIANGAYADACDGIEAGGLGGDWDTTIGTAAKIWYAARPNLGNTPSFGQLAYWCSEACAIFPDQESRLRTVVTKAWEGRGVTVDRNAVDTLTPARGPDDGDMGETGKVNVRRGR